MGRDAELKKLRPEILNAKIIREMSDIEKFQNITLRSVIKFQHDFILELFSNFAKGYQKNWDSLSNEKKEQFIENSINKNQNLKSTFIGCVIGYFTQEELAFYFKNKSELNRRIIQIIKQRILSNLPLV